MSLFPQDLLDAVAEFGSGEFDWFLDEPEEGQEPVSRLMDPEDAWGMCSTVSIQFAEFLRERGFTAYDSGLNVFYRKWEEDGAFSLGARTDYKHPNNPLLRTKHGVSDFGYVDVSGHPNPYDEHSATIVEHGGHIYCIDWAAAQFGIVDSFPVIQEHSGHGWERIVHSLVFEDALA